jgi:hypothetical protein
MVECNHVGDCDRDAAFTIDYDASDDPEVACLVHANSVKTQFGCVVDIVEGVRLKAVRAAASRSEG